MNRRAVGHTRRPGVDEKFRRPGPRRPARPLFAALLAVATLFLTTIDLDQSVSAIEAPSDDSVATVPSDEPPPEDPTPTSAPPVETRPPITANDFIPEERDLTSCIGVLERPGCGSESRGGWRQTLILLAIFGGLAVVFGNVARGVRRNRRDQR